MIEQPYAYRRRELVEPDWRRLPGWAGVTAAEWASAQWQRAHCVKSIRQLRQLVGTGLDEAFYADLDRDQRERATMSMLVTPQMVNTMAPAVAPGGIEGLAARGRDVGGRGADPPLPDEGARRGAAHVPAVLRALHPDGPGRQSDPGHRQAQIRAGQGRQARCDDQLPPGHPRGPRCRRLRR